MKSKTTLLAIVFFVFLIGLIIFKPKTETVKISFNELSDGSKTISNVYRIFFSFPPGTLEEEILNFNLYIGEEKRKIDFKKSCVLSTSVDYSLRQKNNRLFSLRCLLDYAYIDKNTPIFMENPHYNFPRRKDLVVEFIPDKTKYFLLLAPELDIKINIDGKIQFFSENRTYDFYDPIYKEYISTSLSNANIDQIDDLRLQGIHKITIYDETGTHFFEKIKSHDEIKFETKNTYLDKTILVDHFELFGDGPGFHIKLHQTVLVKINSDGSHEILERRLI